MKTRKLIPMLFSTEMARANMEGRKTETRRIMKKQAPEGCKFIGGIEQIVDDWNVKLGYYWSDGTTGNMQGFWPENNKVLFCPYGQPGDVLWMRENWNRTAEGEYLFAATDGADSFRVNDKWKPNIHMPLEACRFFAEITEIRVQRLQSITEESAKSEGAPGPFGMHQFGFLSIWIKINGKESWEQNPWVWVVKYRRLTAHQLLPIIPEIVESRKPGADFIKVHNALIDYCEMSMV
jgi:hypothetical protein